MTIQEEKCPFCEELEQRIIVLENSKGLQFGFFSSLVNEYEVTTELIELILTEAGVEYKPKEEEHIETVVYQWLNKKAEKV